MKHCIYLVAFAATLFSCQPEPDNLRLLDELVVSTNFDEQANFASYSTFAIPTDTIGMVSNDPDETILTAAQSEFPRPVLQGIISNMTSRGYSKVNKNQDPDIGINVAIVKDLNVFQQVVYPNGYYYPGSYYSGYYGYGSYYSYPYVSTYAYNTGVLVIELVDLRNRTPDNKVRVVWTANMGDLYSTIDLLEQTKSAIDQAFVQSPYLKKQ